MSHIPIASLKFCLLVSSFSFHSDSFVCQRWKGGVHPISKPRAKDTHATFYAAAGSSADAETSVVPTARLGLLEEPTSKKDAKDVSDDEEAVQVWIQMRTIQIALESQDPKLKKACLDADKNIGQEVAEAFDIRSGLSPCDECRVYNQGVSCIILCLFVIFLWSSACS